jgi:hypothetical protein
MSPLKLLAFDDEDLIVLSAHLQDAVGRVADMAYLPGERRFVMIVNRFDWTSASPSGKRPPKTFLRRQAALRFDKVERAMARNLTLGESGQVVSLLAVQFEPSRYPSGVIDLIFAGDCAVRLEVECVEAELRDLDAAWTTPNLPVHPEPEEPAEEIKKH